MNYVFFDVECANCLNGEGKICSVGYVLTDESFHVLKKKDILIDPAAPFLLGNVKTGEGIKLAYPLFRFRQARTFPYYYSEIKKLLTDKNNLCFGFAVFQDVSYISYSCHRYSLPLIEFSFFDIQKMEKELSHKVNVSSLDGLVEEFKLTSYTYHRSDDDALMTMEVFKALLDKYQLTVSDALRQYAPFQNDTTHLMDEINKRKKIKQIKRQHQEKLRELFNEPHASSDINLCSPFFYKHVFFFENDLLEKEMDWLLKNKELLERRGALLTRNPSKAEYVVTLHTGKKLHLATLNENVVYIDYQQFTEELNKKGS